jgi:hypothetical protein
MQIILNSLVDFAGVESVYYHIISKYHILLVTS